MLAGYLPQMCDFFDILGGNMVDYTILQKF